MCGICGMMGFGRAAEKVDERLMLDMCETLRHRGPDDAGWRVESFGAPDRPARVGIANARLSIIDIEGGHQPISNEDGSILVVNNGEIYNFRELRADLEKSGHEFTSHSDTEVLAHLYEERGAAMLGDLRGMFAMAIWDARRSELFIARDRLGQKPLHYLHDDERFIFASEIKSILRAPNVDRSVDRQALFHYLTFQYVPHPLTMFTGIRKLPPANYAIISERGMETHEYWRPPFGEKLTGGRDELAAQLRELLFEATRYRMISDVSLGAFLSGGIDSSVIVAIMSQLSDRPVKTFSITFNEADYDESRWARMVAEHCGTEHREFEVRPDALEVLPLLGWHYDEPFADSSAVPTYYVSRETAAHVKVALTGDAGDECFVGYPRYRAVKLGAMFDRLPGFVRRSLPRIAGAMPSSLGIRTLRRRAKRFLEAMNLPPIERYMRWVSIFDDERRGALCSPEFLRLVEGASSVDIFRDEYRESGEEDFIAATTFVDMRRYLPDCLMVKTDIASMANSLETRSPFMDHKVVEFASRLPVSLKLRGWNSKYLLKYAFRDMLPPPILKRAKRGFGAPVAEWFRGELRGPAEEMLLSDRFNARGYFRPEYVRELLAEHVEGRFDHGYRLWSLLMLERWHRRFIDPPEIF